MTITPGYLDYTDPRLLPKDEPWEDVEADEPDPDRERDLRMEEQAWREMEDR